MTIQVEISDFSRFPTAQAFSSYLGLTPSEHSSGEHTRNGAITKQGNRTVRSTLIECVNSLAKGKVGHKSKRINARQKGQPARIISYADQATERLQRKFYRMIDSGKPRNVAITAAARELACFIWGIETNNV
ncbi:transposase [Paucilactobacillus hokkaidonensis]|nr:transposase [Paucilactobacillus hokkaidonensis]